MDSKSFIGSQYILKWHQCIFLCELNVHYDGILLICLVDWNEKYKYEKPKNDKFVTCKMCHSLFTSIGN